MCQTRHKAIAEYSLSNLRNPIAVAEHHWLDAPPGCPAEYRAVAIGAGNATRLIEGDPEEEASPDSAN
ncbi:MAG: hypothetical protein AAF773_02015 [Cyanobacteria bacterium P01_D01_bin.115]